MGSQTSKNMNEACFPTSKNMKERGEEEEDNKEAAAASEITSSSNEGTVK